MITRTCPDCDYTFKKCKKIDRERTCPGCGVGLYYDGEGTILLSVRTAAVKAAGSVVGVLERHISKRDGLDFIFEGACRAKELRLAYMLIERAEGYLSRQIDIGVSAVEFCIEIIEGVLSDPFWSKVTNSIAMFIRYIGQYATEVFLSHKSAIEAEESAKRTSSLSDFLSYASDGGESCYQAVTM